MREIERGLAAEAWLEQASRRLAGSTTPQGAIAIPTEASAPLWIAESVFRRDTVAYTFADFARMASGILGREISRETVSEEAYRSGALQRGFPEPLVGMLISMFEAIRDGEFDVVDSTLERVLGRRPMELEQFLAGFLSEDSAAEQH